MPALVLTARGRRPFAAALLACAVAWMAGGCRAPGPHRAAASHVPAGSPVIAYQGREGVGFADEAGRTRIIMTPRESGHDLTTKRENWFSHLTWSPDGRTLAWAGRYRVHAYDVASGVTRSWVCPCTGIAFLGDRLVAVEHDGAAMLLFDTRRSRPVRRAIVWADGHDDVVNVLSGDGRSAVVTSRPGEPETVIRMVRYHRLDTQGRARPLATVSGNAFPTEGVGTPAGVLVALRFRTGWCEDFERVGLIRPGEARMAEPPSPPPHDRPHYVLHYGWGADGRIYAGFVVSPDCRPGDDPERPPEARSAGEIWRLEGGSWKRTAVAALGYLPGPGGMSARLEGTAEADPRSGRFSGAALVLGTVARPRLVLATGVVDFAFAPRPL